MTDVLLAERRSAEPNVATPSVGPRTRHRRRPWTWVVLVASVALVGAALASLLFDAAQANHRYDRARHSLAVTRDATAIVSRDLATARQDLHLITQQVGDDTTALSQDTSQLQGARSALSAAQAHVVAQATLLNSLHVCLAGVEQALNALAVGNQSKAADALKWVASPCSTAVKASG